MFLRSLVAISAILHISVSVAKPPAGSSPDPAIHEWFESLHQPNTSLPCCSISDCRAVPAAIHDGHYEVMIDEYVYEIPETTIIQGIANPTGKAIACYTYVQFGPPTPPGQISTTPQDELMIFCFVPPRPPS
jgi:hypothetical protein